MSRLWSPPFTARAVSVPTDLAYAERLAHRFTADDRPPPVLRALGPGSPAEVAKRLRSHDGTVALVAVPLSTSFVAPATHAAVAWLQSQTQVGKLDHPAGLEVRWTGDALIGRDYMMNVQALARSGRGGHNHFRPRCLVRRLSLGLAAACLARDDRHQPGHRSLLFWPGCL